MKRFKIVYGILGIILFSVYAVTASYGLSERNINIHEKAMKMQEGVNALGFNKFHIKDYPVAFYNGKKDYVLYNGNTTERKPVFDTLVGTAYKVDNHYEVFIPTVEKLSKMLSMVTYPKYLDNSSNKDIEEYGDNEHIATIWHEAFHAYQMTFYKGNFDGILNEDKLKIVGNTLSSEIDNNNKVKKLYEKELSLLKEAVNAKDINKAKEYIGKYKVINGEREKLLSNETRNIEKYYEVLEGTAFYVESKVYKMLLGDKAYNDKYIENIDKYTEGTHKYYKIGMAKCVILDKLKSDWKKDFDFIELDKLLYKSIEE